MAMDREKLFAFFQAHYLSRQEVLFKLPLNVSIDSFWPELLNRRKAKATVLPLKNAAGMPYWYVLTDRMVAASERLCEEALAQDMAFDPYRAAMTSAMTEEMFFTSFVEGAQIPLQEAMDFLQRGTEPESIHEQMIWNNRHAWAEMIGTLYRPLDEGFVRSMAFMLTEEMDNCAEDYRQTDQHPIAAMNNESYEVPPAYSLPDRMNEYYDFLQKPDVHPLIKAAVAQAYLLVTRPFPEGNERLSRMMSAAVLLRCGYDFFRDISISAVIAKESYRYYKCMCEIIRSENGGDLTYFLEYYLELLVRALDAWKARLQRREQESLERERELARHPLERKDNDGMQLKGSGEGKPLTSSVEAQSEYEKAGEEITPADTEVKHRKIIPAIPLLTVDEYLDKIGRLRFSPNAMTREIPAKMRMVLGAGFTSFSARQWSDITDCDIKRADYDCRFLYEKGLADRENRGKCYVYSLRIITGEEKTLEQGGESTVPFDMSPAAAEADTVAGESPPAGPGFFTKLERMENSRSELYRRAAAAVREMLEKGIMRFSRADWIMRTGMEIKQMRKVCDYMVSHGLVVNLATRRGISDYLFTLHERESNGRVVLKEKPVKEEPVKDEISKVEYSPLLIARLQQMITAENSERDIRIGSFLLNMIDNGIVQFTTEDWQKAFHVARHTITTDLRRAVNLGLLRKENLYSSSTHYIYTIPTSPYEEIRCSNLTRLQRELLGTIYVRFRQNVFTVRDVSKATGYQESSISFHLNNLTEREILSVHSGMGYPGNAFGYSLSVFPKDHPECFVMKTGHTNTMVNSGYTPDRAPIAAAGA